MGTGKDACNEIPREVRKSERCDQLTHQRAREKQEAEARDDPHPTVNLGNAARDEKEQSAECAEKDAVNRARGEISARGCHGCHVAPRKLSPCPWIPPWIAPGAVSTSPAISRVRRKRTGPMNSPTVADRTATTSTVSPTAPGNRSANARPMLIASAPEESRERPMSTPPLRAGRDDNARSQPTTTLATIRAPIAAAAIHASPAVERKSRR